MKHKENEPTMDAKDVEVVSKKTLFKGYFQVDEYIFKHRLFEGGWGGEISREVLERGHAACCLLYDPDLDQLVFLEQFRQGAFAALDSRWYDIEKESPWLIEVVAGIIEYGEQPEDVARREAVEESGCEIKDIELIQQYFASPGCTSEMAILYCGKVDASTASGVHGLADEGEDIRVFKVDVDDAFGMLDDGKFINSTTLIAMLWFRHHHTRLRQKWMGSGK